VSVSQLEVEQVHADLQAVARLTLTAEQVPALTFTEYYDELGRGVQACVQLEQGTFRLWNNSTDPAGRSLVVLASPGEPITQVTALDLPGSVLTQLWSGQGWLTGTDAATSAAWPSLRRCTAGRCSAGCRRPLYALSSLGGSPLRRTRQLSWPRTGCRHELTYPLGAEVEQRCHVGLAQPNLDTDKFGHSRSVAFGRLCRQALRLGTHGTHLLDSLTRLTGEQEIHFYHFCLARHDLNEVRGHRPGLAHVPALGGPDALDVDHPKPTLTPRRRLPCRARCSLHRSHPSGRHIMCRGTGASC
jgi:hypothetical protein